MYFAACHDHDGREAWLDIVFGTFDRDNVPDHVTFGARVGPVENADVPAATLVQAATPYDDSEFFGHKLSRDEALAHPQLQDFWDVLDFVLVADATVNQHVYGL